MSSPQTTRPRLAAQFSPRADAPIEHRIGTPPHPHRWIKDRNALPGSRICKWCGFTLRPDERPEDYGAQ